MWTWHRSPCAASHSEPRGRGSAAHGAAAGRVSLLQLGLKPAQAGILAPACEDEDGVNCRTARSLG